MPPVPRMWSARQRHRGDTHPLAVSVRHGREPTRFDRHTRNPPLYGIQLEQEDLITLGWQVSPTLVSIAPDHADGAMVPQRALRSKVVIVEDIEILENCQKH